jgi:hypothetical protein
MLDMPKLTAKREAMNLYRHGTVKWELTPNAVYQAARQDIRSREFNTWLREERERLNPNAPGYKQELKQLPKRRRYGFLARHVEKAADAAEVLKLALGDQEAGRCSEAVNTVALYDHQNTLAAAYLLACEAGS